VHLEARLVERPEEAEAQDVVHVEVAEEDVDPPQVALLAIHSPDPGAGVEDTEAARRGPHLDA
jgi:hypothetical protein